MFTKIIRFNNYALQDNDIVDKYICLNIIDFPIVSVIDYDYLNDDIPQSIVELSNGKTYVVIGEACEIMNKVNLFYCDYHKEINSK